MLGAQIVWNDPKREQQIQREWREVSRKQWRENWKCEVGIALFFIAWLVVLLYLSQR